ncbi:hypothetical protein D0T84_05910 [Dysgonomonas sp. 521]|uniref:hypothetical protein n=1 Tax=Dysgonomonas sp. 521 TaxID=2302932 RepID=UPI0013D12F44|nr:hypothetical protein [Dysgonomonas sp. 521]NDV94456.1 hypothetical protein [Dysgonomonas sp. 521]
MKTILIILLLCFSLPFFAQELYQDNKNSEYLFAGSISDTSIKVWNLNEKTMDWKHPEELEQTGRLQATSFLSKVFDAGLSFHAEGDEPFWNAEIKEHLLTFTHPEAGKSSYKLKIDVNDFIDNSFSFMFGCEGENIYGLVRGYSYFPREQQVCELCICEEVSFFEIFINFRGHIYKGCAKIEKENE